MKIIRCSWFPPRGYVAITLVWWIVVKTGHTITSTLINHELIHSRQQKEMLVIFFFLWYGLEFIVRLVQYRDYKKAYRNISFEREAYDNEANTGYLNSRRCFAWIHYIKTKN